MDRSAPLFASVLAIAVGCVLGAGLFTFSYGEGAAYMTNDPSACANCHVMDEYLSGWTRSSHRSVAVCNDCHAPHDLAGKLWTKAVNGWNHSVAFTTGDYPEHLTITDFNRRVTEAACRDCHAELAVAVDGPVHDGEARSCVTCHSDVGHRDGSALLAAPRSATSATTSSSTSNEYDD